PGRARRTFAKVIAVSGAAVGRRLAQRRAMRTVKNFQKPRDAQTAARMIPRGPWGSPVVVHVSPGPDVFAAALARELSGRLVSIEARLLPWPFDGRRFLGAVTEGGIMELASSGHDLMDLCPGTARLVVRRGMFGLGSLNPDWRRATRGRTCVVVDELQDSPLRSQAVA